MKKKKETISSRIDVLIAKINKVSKDLSKRITVYSARLTTLRNKFNAHVNEPTASIMIREKDGEWGDWTGIFYVKPEEKLELLLTKTEAHFERYFKENNKGKEFAIFKTINDERQIHKILHT